MNPAEYWALEMQNRQMQQEQQQYNQALLMRGLSDMAGTYAEGKAKKAKGAAYKRAFDVVGPSLGMDEKTLKQFGGQFKNDNDWYEFGETMFPSLGMVSNLRMANRNAGIRENAPLVNAGLKGAERIAGGEGTVPLPEEPPLPVQDDSTLPPSQPRQPSPDVLTAADAWYNQSKGNSGMMQTGTMRPFYRTK